MLVSPLNLHITARDLLLALLVLPLNLRITARDLLPALLYLSLVLLNKLTLHVQLGNQLCTNSFQVLRLLLS